MTPISDIHGPCANPLPHSPGGDPPGETDNESQRNAEKQHRGEGNEHPGILGLNPDVSGQATEPSEQSREEPDHDTNQDDSRSNNHQEIAQTHNRDVIRTCYVRPRHDIQGREPDSQAISGTLLLNRSATGKRKAKGPRGHPRGPFSALLVAGQTVAFSLGTFFSKSLLENMSPRTAHTRPSPAIRARKPTPARVAAKPIPI